MPEKPSIYEQEHEDFRATARQFLAKEVVPHHAQWEADGQVSREVWRKAGEMGLLAFDVDEAYGGAGMKDFRFNMVLIEEISKVGASGLGFPLHTDIIVPYISALGTEEQKQRWLPGLVSGELISAIAMTEPGAGSDLQGISTSAIDKGDHYVVNGSKTFISNGIMADLVVVVARTDPDNGHQGISLLVLERGMEGFERGRNLDKIGMKAQDTAELSFDNVVVPKDNLLGEEGGGFVYLMQNLPQERLSIAMIAVTACEQLLELSLAYVRSGRRSAARSRSSSTRASRSPRWRPRCTSRGSSSTTASAGTTRAPSTRASPPWRSGGRPSCRPGPPTPPSSCTAATAT